MKSVQDIVDLASAFYGSQVLFAALEHDLFSRVEKGEFAHVVESSLPRGLRLLLDACAAEGLLQKSADGYANTPAAKLALVRGGPADLTKAIGYNRDVYPAWGRLAEFVRTNECVERPELHLGEDPARTKAFAEAMFSRAMGIGRSVVDLIDTSAVGGDGHAPRLLDLAGGPGAYAILLAQKNPDLKCVTVDLPAISKAAASFVENAGLSNRIDCRAGDYHTDDYEKGIFDVVTIFGALHQESPTAIVDILRRAAHALRDGGRLYVLDLMTDSTRTAPTFSALFAVNMALTTTNGWVFSDAELKGWMREAGLVPQDTVPLAPPMPHWLVAARKGAHA